MDEKHWLENRLMDYFIEAMNKMHGVNFSIVLHRDRPDFIIKDETHSTNFGVEITHLFYDQDEAKDLMCHDNFSYSKVENIEHYIHILNLILAKKAEKAKGYLQDYELILLVGVTSALFNRDDFEMAQENILVPENQFSTICLVFFNQLNQNWEDLMFLKQEHLLINKPCLII